MLWIWSLLTIPWKCLRFSVVFINKQRNLDCGFAEKRSCLSKPILLSSIEHSYRKCESLLSPFPFFCSISCPSTLAIYGGRVIPFSYVSYPIIMFRNWACWSVVEGASPLGFTLHEVIAEPQGQLCRRCGRGRAGFAEERVCRRKRLSLGRTRTWTWEPASLTPLSSIHGIHLCTSRSRLYRRLCDFHNYATVSSLTLLWRKLIRETRGACALNTHHS